MPVNANQDPYRSHKIMKSKCSGSKFAPAKVALIAADL